MPLQIQLNATDPQSWAQAFPAAVNAITEPIRSERPPEPVIGFSLTTREMRPDSYKSQLVGAVPPYPKESMRLLTKNRLNVG